MLINCYGIVKEGNYDVGLQILDYRIKIFFDEILIFKRLLRSVSVFSLNLNLNKETYIISADDKTLNHCKTTVSYEI